MYKINNKDTRPTPMASFWCLYYQLCTYFTPSSSVSIVNFEHVIAGWEQIFKLKKGYLIQFIDRCIKQFLQKLNVTKAVQDTDNKKQLLIVLPFLDSKSFLVRKRLENCIKNIYNTVR